MRVIKVFLLDKRKNFSLLKKQFNLNLIDKI